MENIKSKYRNCKKWFHGTTLHGLKNIKDKDIDVLHNQGNELDFGHGFYLSPSLEDAREFIKNKIKYSTLSNNDMDKKTPIILEFDIDLNEILLSSNINFKSFNNYDRLFAEFILNNRLKATDFSNVNYFSNDYYHTYDLIFGVMSDSNPISVIQNYKEGILSYDDAITKLMSSTSKKQLSFHCQNLCDAYLNGYKIID